MKRVVVVILTVFLALLLSAGCSTQSGVDSPQTGNPGGGTNQQADSTAGENGTSAPASNFDSEKSISVVSREDGSGTRGAFIELFGIEQRGDDGSRKDLTTKEAIIADKTDVMMTNIANNVYAVGYISLGSLNSSVKALDIDGAPANVNNIKNGSYKIQRPFNIAYQEGLSDPAQDFISFILSREGQDVVAANNYIAIDENPAPYNGSKPTGKIVIAGSSSVTPIMEKLKEAYQDINTGINIEIQMTDSSAGMTSAMEGTCDIGMASRDLKDSEKAELSDLSIALDGIAVIINNDNPLQGLTSEQVKEIFTGETLKWSEL